jgi:hypothetical protein
MRPTDSIDLSREMQLLASSDVISRTDRISGTTFHQPESKIVRKGNLAPSVLQR